jgi:hypothetical protein
MTVGRMQIALGEHGGLRIKTRQDSSAPLVAGCAAQQLILSRYVAHLKPRLRISRALSVMWYVLTVSQVGAMANIFE